MSIIISIGHGGSLHRSRHHCPSLSYHGSRHTIVVDIVIAVAVGIRLAAVGIAIGHGGIHHRLLAAGGCGENHPPPVSSSSSSTSWGCEVEKEAALSVDQTDPY